MASIPPRLHVVPGAGTGHEGAHCLCHQRSKCWELHLSGLQEAGHVADAANAMWPNLVLVLARPQPHLQQPLQHRLRQHLAPCVVLTALPSVSAGILSDKVEREDEKRNEVQRV